MCIILNAKTKDVNGSLAAGLMIVYLIRTDRTN